MLGWINDCLEKLIVQKWGIDAWHNIKKSANIDDIPDNGFLKLEHYPDQSTMHLLTAASVYSGKPPAAIIEEFGAFFVPYIIEQGYENLLCQGSTLKDWLANINAIHQHLQNTFPKKMTMPEFWCEENKDGTLTLFYYSSRGRFLAPLAIGIVKDTIKKKRSKAMDMRFHWMKDREKQG